MRNASSSESATGPVVGGDCFGVCAPAAEADASARPSRNADLMMVDGVEVMKGSVSGCGADICVESSNGLHTQGPKHDPYVLRCGIRFRLRKGVRHDVARN